MSAARSGRVTVAVRTGLGRGALARAALTLAAGVTGTLAVAAPASAHGADAPAGTDYRTEVSAVTPAVAGLTVRAVESGARLELINRTGRTMEVLGYAGEPYLEVRPDGVYENVHSPSTYLNRTLAGDTKPPAIADPTLPPTWQRIAAQPVVRWHDQRTHWLEVARPPQVQADPTRQHRIRDWVVPLRDGTTTMDVRGTLDWLPPPNPVLWWAVSLLGVLVVGTLGLVPVASRFRRPATVTLAAFSTAGALGAIAFAVAREVDTGVIGIGGLLQGLLTGQTWPVITGLGALAAAAYALVRRPAADFAFALAGACLALMAGVTNAAAFGAAVAPVPWPPYWARILIALVIVAGAGVTAAGVLRLRAAGRTAGAGQPRAAGRTAATEGATP
jgi:hypothetical protein